MQLTELTQRLADLGAKPEGLREILGAGEPLNPDVIAKVQDAWGLTIRDGFGQTETTLLVGNTPGQPVKAGSMGRPMPGVPVVLVVNQVDRIKDKTTLLPYLQTVTEGREFAGVVPLSALKRKGLEQLVSTVLPLVPAQDALYGEDEITDKSQRFLAGELVREQLMRQLGNELPYATTVEIESFTVDGTMLRIGAVIWVEREGQKAIVIGKAGSRLKEISTKARMGMERLFEAKVFLETWVRVREGWSDDEAALKALGYGD